MEDFRYLSAVTRFHFAPVFTCTRTFTEPVNIMKHMSASIFEDFEIFFQIYSRVSRLSLLVFLITRLNSFKYSAGPAQTSSTTSIFSRTITVNKMKLLVARSTIAIQNMLWIAIYIYILKIYITILK